MTRRSGYHHAAWVTRPQADGGYIYSFVQQPARSHLLHWFQRPRSLLGLDPGHHSLGAGVTLPVGRKLDVLRIGGSVHGVEVQAVGVLSFEVDEGNVGYVFPFEESRRPRRSIG